MLIISISMMTENLLWGICQGKEIQHHSGYEFSPLSMEIAFTIIVTSDIDKKMILLIDYNYMDVLEIDCVRLIQTFCTYVFLYCNCFVASLLLNITVWYNNLTINIRNLLCKRTCFLFILPKPSVLYCQATVFLKI